MQNTQIRRNRILFALWTLGLLILFFFKGQAAVSYDGDYVLGGGTIV